ncbi:phage baseplate assembly protein [Caballeronia sp. LZ033]|uniref:phage baseplate assembly protein n=1 Tax=Caballeronia sp. LZ033 TaxID=3038566 RepID=UPI00286C37EF|nr:Mu P family protein [Caballeronia sp. LZ033]
MIDDLSLDLNSIRVSGWTRIRVTRGIQRLTSDFDIELTDLEPATLREIIAIPGEDCSVLLGPDKVVTGYVDAVIPSISVTKHAIRIRGRGKCADLVDCSAEWPSGQIAGSNALQIAQKLAFKPYGIQVISDGNDGPSIPLFSICVGETPFDIIERVSRYAGLLAYELPDGNLYLCRAGEGLMSSGVAQGLNVESAVFEWSADQRYSLIGAYQQTMMTAGDYGANIGPVATAEDKTVIRNRKLYFQSEQVISGFELAKARVAWEQSRRAGQSQVVRATVDSWRDAAGKLWEPNSQLRVDLPILKIPEGTMMLIAEVTYRRDETGTHADLVLMPPSAFVPEPIILQNLASDTVLGATR